LNKLRQILLLRQVAILGYVAVEDEGTGAFRNRAELQLRTRRDGKIFSAELLPLHGEDKVGSDLDEGTLKELHHGSRLVALLNQARNARDFTLLSSHAIMSKLLPPASPLLWRLPRAPSDPFDPPPVNVNPGDPPKGGVGASPQQGPFPPVMLVAAPEDLVMASVRGVDDRIKYVAGQGKLHTAVEIALHNRHVIAPQRFQDLVTAYLDDLLAKKDFNRAAQECPRLIGTDPVAWEAWIYRFARLRQLGCLAPLIPTQDPRLRSSIYEMVLEHFLDEDPRLFLSAIRAWGKPNQPPRGRKGGAKAEAGAGAQGGEGAAEGEGHLYRLKEVKDRVRGVLAVRTDPVLLEAQAHLHVYDGDFENALICYWELLRVSSGSSPRGGEAMTLTQTRMRDYSPVFQLIEEHSLFAAVEDKVMNLVRMNRDMARDLLVRYLDRLPVGPVVRQLQGDRRLLLWYLDALFKHAPEQYNAPEYERFHVLQLALYAEAAPPFRPVRSDEADCEDYRSDLLSFLMWSNYITLEGALAECQKRSPPLYNEMVYILGRMANNKDALTILLERVGSVQRAIKFVEANDKSLWQDLIDFSLRTPAFLTGLLRHAGQYNVDLALQLISEIPLGMRIRGLKEKLLAIIASYDYDVRMHQGAMEVR
jgi:vacuolar protein sorting-associated protein 41